MKLIVIGAGAVGIGLAVSVRSRGRRVSLLGRNGPAASGRLDADGAVWTAAFEPPDGSAGPRWVVVATKAPDVAAALHAHAAAVDGAAGLLTLQNGLPGQVPGACRAVAYACARRDERGAVWEGTLRLVLDGRHPRATSWREVLQGGHVACDVSATFAEEAYRKLMISASVHPLCAALRVDCGELSTRPEAVRLAIEAAGDIAALARAEGVRVDARAEEIIPIALARMGRYRPSMLQDLDAGRVRGLELDALVLEPIRRAAAAGTPTRGLLAVRELLLRATPRTEPTS